MVKQHVCNPFTHFDEWAWEADRKDTSEVKRRRRQEIGSDLLIYKLIIDCQTNQIVFAGRSVTYLWNAFNEIYLVSRIA